MHPEAQRLIGELRLQPHPEGGWYRETHRSVERVTTARGTTRSACTAVLYLLVSGTYSAFHRIASDETWHFYRGDPIVLDIIHADAKHERRLVGLGDVLQTTVAGGAHFAAHVDAPDGYALAGCSVAPGFEFADFQLASRAMLLAAYPQHAPLIARYTR